MLHGPHKCSSPHQWCRLGEREGPVRAGCSQAAHSAYEYESLHSHLTMPGAHLRLWRSGLLSAAASCSWCYVRKDGQEGHAPQRGRARRAAPADAALRRAPVPSARGTQRWSDRSARRGAATAGVARASARQADLAWPGVRQV
eukprot:365252-Chlamydomonas_euryale.AAC.59